eukprot:scaffold59538_cov59-Attheya_sp.AAC.1
MLLILSLTLYSFIHEKQNKLEKFVNPVILVAPSAANCGFQNLLRHNLVELEGTRVPRVTITLIIAFSQTRWQENGFGCNCVLVQEDGKIQTSNNKIERSFEQTDCCDI